MEILICTDGSNSAMQSADLVAKLGFSENCRITVLGVSDTRTDVDKLNQSMDLMDKKLSEKYSIKRKIRYGIPSEEILAEALESSYELVAVGGGGGQLGLLHPKIGSTTSKLARKLHTHFLVARNIPEKIGKILVCVGTEAPASETISLGGAWIANTAAKVELLHVLPLKKEESMETSKPGGDHSGLPGTGKGLSSVILERASRQIREVGVKNELTSRLRQGLVVEEVLAELAEGEYDLLVVGAHYQPGQDHWQATLLDDVTNQLLNRSTCSMLII